jgi:cation/acetate symporter
MDLQTWTYIIVGVTFALYIELQSGLAPDQLKNFMLQEERFSIGKRNGHGGRLDERAASFISMAGIISFDGYDGAVYLMGWTGGYVLLALYLPHICENLGNLPFQILLRTLLPNTARTVAVMH